MCRGAVEGKGPQRWSQQRLGRRLEEVAKAVGGGYCRLQMPLRLALSVRGTVAGRRLGAVEGGGVLSPEGVRRAETRGAGWQTRCPVLHMVCVTCVARRQIWRGGGGGLMRNPHCPSAPQRRPQQRLDRRRLPKRLGGGYAEGACARVPGDDSNCEVQQS